MDLFGLAWGLIFSRILTDSCSFPLPILFPMIASAIAEDLLMPAWQWIRIDPSPILSAKDNAWRICFSWGSIKSSSGTLMSSKQRTSCFGCSKYNLKGFSILESSMVITPSKFETSASLTASNEQIWMELSISSPKYAQSEVFLLSAKHPRGIPCRDIRVLYITWEIQRKVG